MKTKGSKKFDPSFRLIQRGKSDDRLNAGLQQFMAGARKFALNYISRDDLCALTREASEVSGISYVMDGDKEEVENILRKVDKSEKTSSNIINLNIEALIKSKALRAQ